MWDIFSLLCSFIKLYSELLKVSRKSAVRYVLLSLGMSAASCGCPGRAALFWVSFLITRFSKFESSPDDCTEDIWVHRESWWFLTLSNDLCELSQIAGLFNYWDNAWKTLDSCKRRAAVIPSFLITMKNAMSACYSKRETHDSFLNISPESRKRVTPSCCRKTACRL